MFWIIYLFLFISTGIISWKKILPHRNIIETIIIGSLWGMILSSVIPFLFGLIFPFYKGIILSIVLCLIVIITLGCWSKNEWKEIFYRVKDSIKKEKKILTILIITFFIIVIPYLFLVSQTLFVNQNGEYATGFYKAYGDVPFHLMYISSFAWGNNFPPQNPDYAGGLSNYPFMPYILSAVLIELGANLITAFLVPLFILSLLIIALLIYVPWRITGEVWVAVLVPFIFLFSGGLGFYWFFQAHGLDIFSTVTKFPNVFLDSSTDIPFKKINLMNVIFSSLLPQRGILFGLPIFLSVILLWFKSQSRSTIVSALLVGSLPLLHPHTFITLIIILPFYLVVLFIKKSYRNFDYRSWIIFFIIVLISVLPVIIFFYPKFNLTSMKSIHFTKGWMLGGDNFIWYWFKNLGIFLPLIIVSLFSKAVPKYLKLWYLPFIPLFIIANLIIFSPWDFDNHKFFNLWYLASAFLIAYFIVILFKNRNLVIKITATILLFFLIISGGIDILRTWNFSKGGWGLFNPGSQELAEFLKENTPSQSIFLSSTSHLSPIILSGRKYFVGYTGWLFAHGIDYSQRLNNARIIYEGGEQSKLLIKKWGITHILIGNQELSEFSVNLPFFEENYEKIYDKNNYKVFVVK